MQVKKYLMVERVKVLWLIQSNPVDDFDVIAFVPQGPEQSSMKMTTTFADIFNRRKASEKCLPVPDYEESSIVNVDAVLVRAYQLS